MSSTPPPPAASAPATRTPSGEPISDKSRTVALLLCILLGGFGIHRFYVGKIGTGILWLVTLGFLGIGVIIDLVLIIVGTFKDKQGRVVYNWQ